MTHKTGWPPPPLAQDDDRKLFRWLALKPDARALVRERCARIKEGPPAPCPSYRDCTYPDCSHFMD